MSYKKIMKFVITQESIFYFKNKKSFLKVVSKLLAAWSDTRITKIKGYKSGNKTSKRNER